MELKNRVAIITGGGTGIGKATALLFAKEGAKVVVTGRREQPLRSTVDEITGMGGSADFALTDVGDREQVDRLFNQASSKFGDVDILFCCAGVFISWKATQDYTDKEWDDTFRANFWGTLYCCKNAIPQMQRRGKGSIIICSSVAGQFPFKNHAAYNSSKAAVEMLSKCMAKDLGPNNIRVNTICPGLTDTDMALGHVAKLGREAIAKSFPLGRMGLPIDIAEAVLFLASDRSSWITGHSLFVDGGTHCY
jgi:NAD(P)-dependent dehydrogenase (short-subunit alcohol dehydrogenase family)